MGNVQYCDSYSYLCDMLIYGVYGPYKDSSLCHAPTFQTMRHPWIYSKFSVRPKTWLLIVAQPSYRSLWTSSCGLTKNRYKKCG
jgi:hypothetical protein